MKHQGAMNFQVDMLAFGEPGEVRYVWVPTEEMGLRTDGQILNLIFHYGQNDFQPQRHPSVSVGDVIHLFGHKFRVEPIGFSEV